MKTRPTKAAPAPVRLPFQSLAITVGSALALGACTGPAPIVIDRPLIPPFQVSPDGWVITPRTSQGGNVPDIGAISPLSTSGAFTFEGELAPGSATFSAVVVDVTREEPPSAVGAGSFTVPVDGTDYTRTDIPAIAAVLPDDSDMVVLGAYVLEAGAAGEIGTVLWVMVPESDVASGAVVALDGESRVAVFGTGPIESESPETAAVAVTGTLTFGAVDLAVGGVVEATLAADFGRAVFEDPGPIPDPDPAPPFATGSYELVVGGAAEAHCDGGLAGRTAELSALGTADYGLSGGALDVSGPPEALSFSGAAIEASFGAPAVGAAWMPEAGAYAAFSEGGGAGALGLTEEGRFLLTDGPDGMAMIGVLLADPSDATGSSFCQVAFAATITSR